MKYVIYEKSYIERLGNKIDDEVNIGDSDTINGVVKLLKSKRDLDLNERTIYRSLKSKQPIKEKYFIFRMKD